MIPKIIWYLFKNYIFNILLVEWQVNQATPSLRWLNYIYKKKWINTLTPWLLNHVFLNVWIMVCSWTRYSWPMKCIFANTKTSYWMRSKFIDLNYLRLKWGKATLLFLSRSEISTSLAIPFWAWIIFLSWNKSWLGSHPTLGGKRKFHWEKTKSREKAKKA